MMPNPDLAQLIEDFLGYLVQIRGYSEQTALTYETALQQMQDKCSFYQEKNGWVLDIMPFRLEIRHLAKRSIHSKLTAIRSFVHYLNDHTGLNVTAKGTDTIKVPQTLPKPIEESAIEEVIADATPEEELLIAMLYGLGLRIGELSSMRLEWITDEWIEVHGKGNKVRQLPILPYLQKLILRHIQSNTPKKYLFEKNGDPLNVSQLRYKLTKLFKKHGFRATPHQLRHSFATHLLAHGARIADVSELLGHSSMATTQVYTKLGSVKKMDEYMSAHPLACKRKNI